MSEAGYSLEDLLARRKLEFCALELERQVLTVTIARPEVLNALHPPACREIGRVLDLAELSPSVRVTIITGEGARAFCVGFDLRYADSHPEIYQDVLFGSELTRRAQQTKPLIAAINGAALGFGFELALACDLIIAQASATFALPEPKVGLAAMAGGIARLTRDIGAKRALGIVLTARSVTAAEGQALGFVNEVCAQPVLAVARQYADAIAAGAPLSIVASREIAYRGRDLPDFAAALDPRNYPSIAPLLSSDDAVEGRRAFLEKRKPQWRGR